MNKQVDSTEWLDNYFDKPKAPIKHPRKLKKRLKAIATAVNNAYGGGYLVIRWDESFCREFLSAWRRALWLRHYKRELWWLGNYAGEGISYDKGLRLRWDYEYDNGLYCETHYGYLDYLNKEPGKVMHEDLHQVVVSVFYHMHPDEEYGEDTPLPFRSDRGLLRWLADKKLPLPYGYKTFPA